MKFLHTLLATLLLLAPLAAQDKQANAVPGLKLPATIPVTASDLRKKIVPVFDKPETVLQVEWIVIPSGKSDPSYAAKGQGKTSYLEIDVPPQDEAYLVYCYARLSVEPYLTKPASTMVEWGSGEPPPPTQPPVQPPVQPPITPPVTPPTTPPIDPNNVDQVFASVKNLHAILIVDVQNATRPVAQISQEKAYFKKHLEQPGTNNHWWSYDVRAKELASQGIIKKLVDAQGKVIVPLPVLVLIDGNKTPATMSNPIPLTFTGDVAKDAATILLTIAGAVKK